MGAKNWYIDCVLAALECILSGIIQNIQGDNTMRNDTKMRDFGLEVFFSEWEFKARHHMTASDIESMSVSDLLAFADDDVRADFQNLWLGYTETWGAPDLRQAIANTYEQMKPANILCMAGAGEGIYATMKVLLDANDHVIVPVPNYQSAETVPLSICDVTGVPMRCETGVGGQNAMTKGGWRLDIDDVKAAIKPNTKLISLNFPHNPTGTLMPRKDLDALVALCRERGIYIFSDEVYRGVELDPDDQMPQLADVYEKGISLNVMSKAYGLPGLRIGWLAMQDLDLLERIERYKHYLSICNSGPSERLALIALTARDRIFSRNHQILSDNVALLEQLFDDFPGLVEWVRPMGGCVAFPKYIGPGNGEDFCRDLIQESSVLLLPSSIYESELLETPKDHFRIGFGRDTVFKEGLIAMRKHFDRKFPGFAR